MDLCRFLLVVVALTMLSWPAQAMRCGRDLVSIGDTATEVRRLCGNPSDIVDREEQTTYGVQDPVTGAYIERSRTVLVAEWTYNFGPRRLMRLLSFHNGRVVRIQSLDYGF